MDMRAQTLLSHDTFTAAASGTDTEPAMTLHVKKPRILIVDDDCLIRELIKDFYQEYDLELFEAANGREAVEMAHAHSPDLILLDIQMPVMNGYMAAAILKNEAPVKNIPILVITTHERSEVTNQISGMFDGYMSKPFKKNQLIQETIQFMPGITNMQEGKQKAQV
jgi:CheY-like chemotaxis protein